MSVDLCTLVFEKKKKKEKKNCRNVQVSENGVIILLILSFSQTYLQLYTSNCLVVDAFSLYFQFLEPDYIFAEFHNILLN